MVASLLAIGETRDQCGADARCERRRKSAVRVAADATLAVTLLLRPLWAREKEKKTKPGVSDSMRRRLSEEKKSFRLDAEYETLLRGRTSFGRCRRGACEAG